LSGRWYLIDFARSRHTNPARIPVSPAGCWYNTVLHSNATSERLTMFSDGVFAVLITMLVLELRAPELPTLRVLLPLWPTWLSYPVSYLFIAIVWTNHHYVLCNASEATPRLLWFKRWARVTKAKAALQGVLVTPPGSTR